MSSIVQPDSDSNSPTEAEIAQAEEIVRAEWLNSVDTDAITDYGTQDAVHAAMNHMRDSIAQALADQRAKYEAISDDESLASAPDDYPTAYYNGWEDGAWDMAQRIRQVSR